MGLKTTRMRYNIIGQAEATETKTYSNNNNKKTLNINYKNKNSWVFHKTASAVRRRLTWTSRIVNATASNILVQTSHKHFPFVFPASAALCVFLYEYDQYNGGHIPAHTIWYERSQNDLNLHNILMDFSVFLIFFLPPIILFGLWQWLVVPPIKSLLKSYRVEEKNVLPKSATVINFAVSCNISAHTT